MANLIRSAVYATVIFIIGIWAYAACNAPDIPLPPPTVTPSASTCDATLWDHVYHSARLQVIQQCISVSGIVEGIRQEADGDLHIRLKLDSQFQSLVNDKNISDQGGDLVVEPVCVNPPTQADAVDSCAGFRNAVPIPQIGSRVVVIGSYVLDTFHGWMEIHPVTTILPSGGF